MHRRDLKAGDRVFVRLAYHGHYGDATIMAMHSDTPTIMVKFDDRAKLQQVWPRHVVRKSDDA